MHKLSESCHKVKFKEEKSMLQIYYHDYCLENWFSCKKVGAKIVSSIETKIQLALVINNHN